jgi:hypothetical protein
VGFRICFLDQRNPSITGDSRLGEIQRIYTFPSRLIISLLVKVVDLLLIPGQLLVLRDPSEEEAEEPRGNLRQQISMTRGADRRREEAYSSTTTEIQ